MNTPQFSASEIATALGQHQPTEEQRAVIEAPLAPLLVVAGAGSGKTETMAARVVYLVANGFVRPEQVLGLTFTRKAAGELADRVRLRLRQLRARGLLTDSESSSAVTVEGAAIATYNSFAADIATEHALRIGMDPDSRLITEAGAWQLAHEVVTGWQGSLNLSVAPRTVTENLLSLANALNEHLLSPHEASQQLIDLRSDLIDKAEGKNPLKNVRDIAASLEERREVLQLVVEFTRRKRQRGLVEFGDQVAQAARIAREIPEVGQQLREQFRLVLLDEYQDTSVAQLELLRCLFGGGHAVTAVGDPNQAIYGWRGAAAATLGRFPRDFPDGDGKPAPTRYLRTSWRNDTAILQVANVVAAPLRGEQAASSVDVPELTSRPGAGTGEVFSAYTTAGSEEVEAVADFFAQRWVEDGDTTYAVLCRSRKQFEPIVAALEKRRIPVEVVGLGGLLMRPEIVDLRSILLAAHDPSRGDAVMRLLTGLRLGIAEMHALRAWSRAVAGQAGEASLAEALNSPPPPGWHSPEGHAITEEGMRRITELGQMLRRVRSLTSLTLPELIMNVVRLANLDIEVAARGGNDPMAARANLDKFVQIAVEFGHGSEYTTLGAFLDWLDAAEERERGLEPATEEPHPGAVQVLTVHAAKGLEWDVVAVPGLVEKQFPFYESKAKDDGAVSASAWLTDRSALPYSLRGDADSLPVLAIAGTTSHKEVDDAREEFRRAAGAHLVAEERRLAYVAVTRARHELLLTGSWFRDGKEWLPPSRFLLEPHRHGLVMPIEPWAPTPAEGAANPDNEKHVEVVWPIDPLGERRPHAEAAAQRVRELMAQGSQLPTAAHLGKPAGEDDTATPHRWWRDAQLLLAEREAARSAVAEVSLGHHLSATAAVGLASDPQRFAVDRRRPIPQPPSTRAQLGNRFHAWVEEFYARPSLLELDEHTGRDFRDDGSDLAPLDDATLSAMQERFRNSDWARRQPVAVEVDLEIPVGGTFIRCRIDAVFDDEHGIEVVDWKTGVPPRDERVQRNRELQLALYRLGWARRSSRPLTDIGAAFYYVATGETIRAAALNQDDIESRLRAAIGAAGGRSEVWEWARG